MPPLAQAVVDNAHQIASWMFQGLLTILLAVVAFQSKDVIERVDSNTQATQENMRSIVRNETKIESVKSFYEWIKSDIEEIKADIKKIEGSLN